MATSSDTCGKCPVHEFETLSFYCGKHDVDIFGRCILSEHMTCEHDVVDFNNTHCLEYMTNELLCKTLKTEGNVSELQVRVDENDRQNNECKALYVASIKQYRKRLNARLNKLQSTAEMIGEEKHKINMKRLIDISKTCKDASSLIHKRKELIKRFSDTKQERNVMIQCKKLENELSQIGEAIEQSHAKNQITRFIFEENSKLEYKIQKEVTEIGTLREVCDGSEEAVEENSKLTDSRENMKKRCFICFYEITNPKKLACGHVFCLYCIDSKSAIKPCCPTCGYFFGIHTGDQPPGTMTVTRDVILAAIQYSRIRIVYDFTEGQYCDAHPSTFKQYGGATHVAYLPDNEQGENICRMIKVAFRKKSVLSVKDLSTEVSQGVVVFNDIQHNTEWLYANCRIEPDFFEKVTEQLKAKAVTLADIDPNDTLEETITVNLCDEAR